MPGPREVLLAAVATVLLAAGGGAEERKVNSVSLPLGDYKTLIDRIAAVERARDRAVEPAIAELVAQTTAENRDRC